MLLGATSAIAGPVGSSAGICTKSLPAHSCLFVAARQANVSINLSGALGDASARMAQRNSGGLSAVTLVSIQICSDRPVYSTAKCVVRSQHLVLFGFKLLRSRPLRRNRTMLIWRTS
jgi:hypothetical protein